MSGSNLGDEVRRVISFSVFITGIIAAAFGAFIFIDSIVTGKSYLFEGSVIAFLGIIAAYISDLSMIHRKKHKQTEELIKQNNLLSQRANAGQGGGLFGMMFGPNSMFGMSNVEIIDESGNTIYDPQSGTTVQYEDASHPNVQNEIKALMLRSGLEEEDAKYAVFLKDKDLNSLKSALRKAEKEDRFELARFIQRMIDEKK